MDSPAIRETWVQSLGWEDPLEKEMATHSSVLPWRIPWTEEPGGLQSIGLQSQTEPKQLSIAQHIAVFDTKDQKPFFVNAFSFKTLKNLL